MKGTFSGRDDRVIATDPKQKTANGTAKTFVFAVPSLSRGRNCGPDGDQL